MWRNCWKTLLICLSTHFDKFIWKTFPCIYHISYDKNLLLKLWPSFIELFIFNLWFVMVLSRFFSVCIRLKISSLHKIENVSFYSKIKSHKCNAIKIASAYHTYDQHSNLQRFSIKFCETHRKFWLVQQVRDDVLLRIDFRCRLNHILF